MRVSRSFLCLGGLFFGLILASCGGGSSSNQGPTSPTNNPVPAIQSVSPNAVALGSTSTTLTVTGSNFVQGSTVMWNTTALTTTFVSSAQVTATIPASAIPSTPGSVNVSVSNPAPGGGPSSNIAVMLEYPLPNIVSLIPSGVVLGSSGFTLTVNGSNFVSGALVYWNGVSRVTTFVSSTELTAAILASDLAVQSGTTAAVTVENPSPSAGYSNVAQFNLENPAPVISSVTPTSGLAGTAYLLSITGTGFQQGAVAQVAGIKLSTTYNSTTSLSASMSSLVPVGSSLALTVSNPTPTVGSSNAVTLSNNAAGKPTTLTLASVDNNGNAVDSRGLMSVNARYFTFWNYVRDTCLEGPGQCTPSSITYTNPPSEENSPAAAPPTPDGRYVAFTRQTGINTHTSDLERADTCTGAGSGCAPADQTLVPVSQQAEIDNQAGSITPDGRYVAYSSADPPWNPIVSAYVFDTCNGAAPNCTPSSILEDSSAFGVPETATDASSGSLYLIYTLGTISGPDTTSGQIAERDTCLGAAAPGCSPSTTTLSSSGESCFAPSVSANGQWVAYLCTQGNSQQVFIENTCIGATGSCTPTATQITTDFYGAQDNVGVSDDGRFVTYTAYAPIIQGQQLGPTAMVYDTCNGAPSGCTSQAAPVCLNSQGALANLECDATQISGDGQYVLVYSQATNLAPSAINDTNGSTGASYIAPNPLK